MATHRRDRHPDHEGCGGEEEHLEHDREIVENEETAEGRPGISPDHRDRQSHRQQECAEGEPACEYARTTSQDEIDHQHDERRAGHDDLRRQRRVVDLHSAQPPKIFATASTAGDVTSRSSRG
jgi:hypothetical protein